MKSIRYALEGFSLWALFVFFKALPPESASNIGGWIGRTIGPNLAASRKAIRHVAAALPDKSASEVDEIVRGMWDNLGRVIAEYPHLERLSIENTTVIDNAGLKDLLAEQQPVVFIGAHLANWEINATATLTQLNEAINLTFREPNNPWVASLLSRSRTLKGRLQAFPKSRASGRLILQSMRENERLGILIDQKYNEGVSVDFFNMPAMTNPIFVQICQKYKCPLIPVRNERLSGAHFKLTAYPALTLFDNDGQPLPTADVIKQAHDLLESWITERPAQWLWLHKRWKEI